MNYKKALLYAIPILVGGFIIFRMAYAQKPKGRTTPQYDPTEDKDEFPLKKGSSGAKVRELQNALLSRDPNSLPKFGADGDFGSETETALLNIEGKKVVNSQSELDAIKKGGSVSSDFPLKRGSRGAKVRELQKALMDRNIAILPKYGADGDFGVETENAVFQFLRKKTVDSQADIEAIKSGSTVLSSDFPLKRGSRGAKVRELQLALLKKDSKILPRFGADGDFGAETENAVLKVLNKKTVDSQAELNSIK